MIAAALLACAANVAPVTLEAVIRVESGGNPLAINVNHLVGPQPRPATLTEAVATAQHYVANGYSVDLGLMQVNSRNLAALGTTIAQVLDPCANVKAGAAILTANYAEAVRSHGEGQAALHVALSAYNTGSSDRGFANGYVAQYYGSGGLPAVGDGVQQAVLTVAAVKRVALPKPPNPYTADPQIYAREVPTLDPE